MACSDNEVIQKIEEGEEYPTLIKGYVDGKHILIEDKESIIVRPTLYVHTFQESGLTAKEMVYWLQIKIEDRTTIFMNLCNPVIEGKKYQINKGKESEFILRGNCIFVDDAGVIHNPKKDDFIEVKVESATLYDCSKRGYYIHLLINGDLYDSDTDYSPFNIQNLEIRFYSQLYL